MTLTAHWLALPTVAGAASASATVGVPCTWTPTITGQAGYTVTSTALPAGLTSNSGSGEITGTPSGAAGATPVTITVTDSHGSTDFALTITVAHGAAAGLQPPDRTDTLRQGQVYVK